MTGTVEPFHDPDRPPSPGASASAGQGTTTTSDHEARKRRWQTRPGGHRHTVTLPQYDAYGVAADVCWENVDGELWIDNGEYASRVNYCPWCGYAAPNPYDAGLTDDE